MEVIVANWEKENLNKNVIEIGVNENDSCQDVYDVIEKKELDCDYMVLKLPATIHKHLFKLQENGFTFVESQISLSLSLKNVNISKFERLSKRYSFIKVENEHGINSILDNISSDMFRTDRIALDPKFGLEVANDRYKKWLLSEYTSKNSDIFRIMKSEKDVGFVMINDNHEEIMNILLGGIYSKYQDLGVGFNIVYQPIDHFKKSSKSLIKTKVSSNNMNVIRLYIEMGYEIEAIDYIYVKHKEDSSDAR